MASDINSERNDEADLVLTWSGRWTLTHRILAVNLLTLVLVGLSIIYLDSYRNRLEKERVRKVAAEATMAATALAHVPATQRATLLANLARPNQSRMRVYSAGGALELDSWRSTGPTYRLRDPAMRANQIQGDGTSNQHLDLRSVKGSFPADDLRGGVTPVATDPRNDP